MNKYVYVGNNPIGASDPSGLGDFPGTWDNGVVANNTGAEVVVIDMDDSIVTTLKDKQTSCKDYDYDFLYYNGSLWKIGPNNVSVEPNGEVINQGPDFIPGENPRPATEAEKNDVYRLCPSCQPH